MKQIASKRRGRTCLECLALESRALLSNGLTPSVSTNQTIYQPGQAIQIQFTETNNTSRSVQFVYGAVNDGFDISEGGNVVFKSNGGINPLVLVDDTLQPGRSKSFDFTWDGVPGTPFPGTGPILAGGTFTVTNQLDPSVSATFQIVSPLNYSFTLDAPSYQVGQPIGISLTQTNTSSQSVSVTVNPAAFTATNGLGQTLWQYQDSSASPTTETLAPGQSIAQTATWDDVANAGPFAGGNVWGSFTVTSPNAPQGLGPMAEIVDPVSFGLVALNNGVAPGQPVTFQSVAEDTGTVPVTIPESAGELTVTNNVTGVQVYSTSVAATAPTITLQPGQSWTQSITWPSSATDIAPGLYNAYFENGLAGYNTQVQIGTSNPPPISVPPMIPVTAPDGLAANVTSQQLGNHEQFTLTLTNFENQTVDLKGKASVARFTLKEHGKVIWRSSTKTNLRARALQSLSSGDAIEFHVTWPGGLHKSSAKGGKPTVYQLTATVDGQSGSTTF